MAWLADQLGFPWTAIIPANAIGAWLGVAFVLGASARTIPTGALRGLLGLLSAVGSYYVLTGAFGEGFRTIGASHAATIWGTVSLVAGPLLGAAGATWRHSHGWPRALGVAALAAPLIAEAVVYGSPRLAAWVGIDVDPGVVVLVIEAVIGLALPAVLLARGERLPGYVFTTGLAVAGAVAIGPVTDFLRGLADRF